MKRGIVQHQTPWKNLTIQCQGELQILLSKWRCNEYCLYDVGVQVCSCVFNRMYLSMVLCFHWNVLNIHIQMYSDYTLV